MKKIIQILLMLLSLNDYSQSHLKILDIPLTGNIENFTPEMTSKNLILGFYLDLPPAVRASDFGPC